MTAPICLTWIPEMGRMRLQGHGAGMLAAT